MINNLSNKHQYWRLIILTTTLIFSMVLFSTVFAEDSGDTTDNTSILFTPGLSPCVVEFLEKTLAKLLTDNDNFSYDTDE